jgi:hypothetical protein
MATIAKAAAARYQDDAGVRRRVVGNYTGPTSYAQATGDVITAAQLGLGKVEAFNASNIPCDSSSANNRIVNYLIASDGSSVEVHWFTALGTEVADAVDLSTYTIRFEALGT